ncbi:MAG: hypothetical protein GY795_46945, partial [Desulfobacterales bacterium]|nr:hypothetical protein [Desulfobacterales bacterium]
MKSQELLAGSSLEQVKEKPCLSVSVEFKENKMSTSKEAHTRPYTHSLVQNRGENNESGSQGKVETSTSTGTDKLGKARVGSDAEMPGRLDGTVNETLSESLNDATLDGTEQYHLENSRRNILDVSTRRFPEQYLDVSGRRLSEIQTGRIQAKEVPGSQTEVSRRKFPSRYHVPQVGGGVGRLLSTTNERRTSYSSGPALNGFAPRKQLGIGSVGKFPVKPIVYGSMDSTRTRSLPRSFRYGRIEAQDMSFSRKAGRREDDSFHQTDGMKRSDDGSSPTKKPGLNPADGIQSAQGKANSIGICSRVVDGGDYDTLLRPEGKKKGRRRSCSPANPSAGTVQILDGQLDNTWEEQTGDEEEHHMAEYRRQFRPEVQAQGRGSYVAQETVESYVAQDTVSAHHSNSLQC